MQPSMLGEKAYELGFDALAVTEGTPLTVLRDHLEHMQRQGNYPPFVESDIELRLNHGDLLPSIQSIVVVAMAYKSVDPEPPPRLHGVLSRYAWGLDYHKLMLTRLNQLAMFVTKEMGSGSVAIAVDTKPLLERSLAARSGLGYVGHNCSVFVPPFGSWVFLGELVTDRHIDSSTHPSPVKPCHVDCNRCVESCPTRALSAPYVCNPHLCISYLTQMKGMIPRHLRRVIGRQLWGCDICQQVCPTNAEAVVAKHPQYHPRRATSLPLLPLVTMSNREFRSRFGSTAMGWRGKGTLQRNAAICLGNSADPSAISTLQDGLSDPKAVVQQACVWALGAIGGKQATSILNQARRYAKDPSVGQEINYALAAVTP